MTIQPQINADIRGYKTYRDEGEFYLICVNPRSSAGHFWRYSPRNAFNDAASKTYTSAAGMSPTEILNAGLVV